MQVVKQTVEVVTFKCEACGAEFHNKHDAAAHEKTHLQSGCEHPKIWYERIIDDNYGAPNISIIAQCQDCLLKAEVYIPDYDQTGLAKIFEVLYGSKALRAATEVAKEKVADWEAKQAEFQAKYGRAMTDEEKAMFGRGQ